MNCKRYSYCKSTCIKKGKIKGVQRYQCTSCKKYQQSHYVIKGKNETDIVLLKKLHKVGLGISGIAKVLEISKTTVQRKIEFVAKSIIVPEISETGQE